MQTFEYLEISTRLPFELLAHHVCKERSDISLPSQKSFLLFEESLSDNTFLYEHFSHVICHHHIVCGVD